MAETEVKEGSMEQGKTGATIKEDWYQTDTQVILVLLVKNVDDSLFKADFKDSIISIKLLLKNTPYEKVYNLSHNIIPSKCTFKVYSTKVEVRLAKAEGVYWTKLEKDIGHLQKKVEGRNWDRVVAEFEEDQPEGEAALNALFQKIYNEGPDEVKKAMNKSFLESGGTELNTNWDAVKKDTVSIKPPEGMEWKTWDQ